jgi:hypothetical protein
VSLRVVCEPFVGFHTSLTWRTFQKKGTHEYILVSDMSWLLLSKLFTSVIYIRDNHHA